MLFDAGTEGWSVENWLKYTKMGKEKRFAGSIPILQK
jgi:hypothetical protein